MYVYKNFSLRGLWSFAGFHVLWIAVYSSVITLIYEYTNIEWLVIPWLPISVIGTAVAFYIGFKNNQAYNRLWEARKIWGAIVNSSRSWAATVKAFINDDFTDREVDPHEINNMHRALIKRHIAYLYQLRRQLLVPTSWEHINQNRFVARLTQRRFETIGKGLVTDTDRTDYLRKGADENEIERIGKFKNSCTHIIDAQSQELAKAFRHELTDSFRHMELQKILNEFYVHQGKCERIKKFPLPRQYGATSFIFVMLFILLLPLGMVSEFSKLGEWGPWLSVPFTVIVGWVYMVMELVGDYSENPFEGLGNDIPMLSLCRTIEIDLLEMIGEEEIPEPVKAKNGILM